MKGNWKNLVGKKFNRLLVIKRVFYNGAWDFWLCICDCGKKTIVMTSNLTHKYTATKSCGCYKIENPGALKHGLRNSRFYRIWYCMYARVKKEHTQPQYYYNRGIKNEWKSFIEFKNDMYESYLDHVREFGEKQTTIDRINNDKDYCKSNCRWATLKEQANNKRNIIKS